MDETERALRAATCEGCRNGWPLVEDRAKHRKPFPINTKGSVIVACTSNGFVKRLLPLFNAGIAGAYAAAAKAVDASRDKIGRIMHETWTKGKRAQGFHHPYEAAHGITEAPCPKCHADLMDWDELPQEQKDFNLRAFDDVLPVLTAAILALTPADARQALEQIRTEAYQRGEDEGITSGRYPPDTAAIASAEAQARLEEHLHYCDRCMLATPKDYCYRGKELYAAVRTPDSTEEQG